MIVTVNTAVEGLFSLGRRSLVGKELSKIFIDQQKVFSVIERARKYQSRYTLREVKFEKPTSFA